jgi:hypothetical protein
MTPNPLPPDLTRWNRAGLSRFDYLDGNGAAWLERLRHDLAQAFPAWPVWAQLPAPPADPSTETEDERLQRLAALYAADPDDLLWQLVRQFARSAHVLGVHLDAQANEGYLRTASQWDSLRRLLAVLDEAPRPPASAATPLALQLKPGLAGTVAAGLQVQHLPASGAPRVFETLADLAADAAFNTLYARDHLANPAWLAGSTLTLDRGVDELKAGEPLVLEDTQLQRLSAHRIEGVFTLPDGRSRVSISPAVPKTAALHFTAGHTLVHLLPKDRLAPRGPASEGVAEAGHSLQLAVPSGTLAPGDLVLVRAVDDKPRYRRIKAVHDDRLVFTQALGALRLLGATVDRPVTVPLTDMAEGPAAAPCRKTARWPWWSMRRATGRAWPGCGSAMPTNSEQHDKTREVWPSFYCLHAKYVPVDTSRERLRRTIARATPP